MQTGLFVGLLAVWPYDCQRYSSGVFLFVCLFVFLLLLFFLLFFFLLFWFVFALINMSRDATCPN